MAMSSEAGRGGLAGGSMILMFAVLAVGYLLTLVSQEGPLPVPKGMYYFQPNGTQALLQEGKRLDEQMMLAAAEQKQRALAAAKTLLLTTSQDKAHPNDADGLSVAHVDADAAALAAAAASLNYSRALMVYDLVFEDDDAWLGEVVDRVQLWNKLFLKQRKSRNWRVSLIPREREVPQSAADEERVVAMSTREAKAEAAATAKDYLASLVGERTSAPHAAAESDKTSRDGVDLTTEELDVLARLFLAEEAGANGRQESGFQPVPVHVLLAADSGNYSGAHELRFIYAAMRYKTALPTPQEAAAAASPSSDGVEMCVDATFGFFKRPVRDPLTLNITRHWPVPVLAVTTGILTTRAAACVAYVLSLPMFDIQSMTFMGTAGVSPVVGGGGWNPEAVPFPSPSPSSTPSSAAATSPVPSHVQELQRTDEYANTQANLACQSEWSPNAVKVGIGSVCVTHAAILQECGICQEETPVNSLCSRPRCVLHNSSTFFGPCNFQAPHNSRRLAERMKGAMVGREFPSASPLVKAGQERFWAANEAMPKYRRIQRDRDVSPVAVVEPEKGKQEEDEVVYEYLRDAPEKPMMLNCAEVDTNLILSGPRSDALCREYSYTLLHTESDPDDWEARKRQIRREQGKETEADRQAGATPRKEMYPRSELTCVQAMEGFAFLHALISSEHSNIPAALVRAGSNYDMYPLRKVVRPVALNAFKTREEVLAMLKDGTLQAGDSTTAPSSAANLDVDGMPQSQSVGAAGRKLRQLFSRGDIAEDHLTRSRLRLTAEDVAEAREMLKDTQGTASGAHAPNYYVSWEQDTTFMPVEAFERFTKLTYQYAVETSSAVVLNFFLRDDTRLPGRPLERPTGWMKHA